MKIYFIVVLKMFAIHEKKTIKIWTGRREYFFFIHFVMPKKQAVFEMLKMGC